jgi:hypothetical protein
MIRIVAIAFVSVIVLSCGNKRNETAMSIPYTFDMIEFLRESDSCNAKIDAVPCVSYEVTYPKFFGLPQAANDSLIKRMALIVGANDNIPTDSLTFEKSAQAFMEDYNAVNAEFPGMENPWSYAAVFSVKILSDTLVSLTADVEYYTGGAHGGYGTTFINVHPITGVTVGLSDILKAGYEQSLTRIAEQEFRKNLELSPTDDLYEAGFEFPDGKFVLNNNYGFTQEGIHFVYNPYEIAPYAMGSQSFIIPYEAIQSLLK